MIDSPLTLTLSVGDVATIVEHLSCLADPIDGQDERYQRFLLNEGQRQVLTDPPASFTNDPAQFGAQIRELADRVEAQLPDSAPIIRPSQARMGSAASAVDLVCSIPQ
jgi:hypothetical protein